VVWSGLSIVQKKSAGDSLPVLPNAVVGERNKIAPIPEKTIVPVASEVPLVVPPQPVKNLDDEQLQIDALLQDAQIALSMGRLTAPIEDSAYSAYQKILAIDSKNIAAKSGLDDLAQRYLIMYREQINLGNADMAKVYMKRARFVSSYYVDAHFNGLEDADVNSQDLSTSSAPISSDVTDDKTTKPMPIPKERSDSSALQSGSVLHVATTSVWKDEQMSRAARAMLQEGKVDAAQTQLKQFIAAEKSPVLSLEVLADTYIQQQDYDAVVIIIDKAINLPDHIKSKIMAKVFVAKGNNSQAILTLEKSLPAAEDDEEFRALLASLYHKAADYQKSIICYQRLIARFGDKPAYWLGLSLAYDGLGQSKNALQAYQFLAGFPQLQPQVKQYTQQRITALRSE
jgi:MSHA biogenesis protein MshN